MKRNVWKQQAVKREDINDALIVTEEKKEQYNWRRIKRSNDGSPTSKRYNYNSKFNLLIRSTQRRRCIPDVVELLQKPMDNGWFMLFPSGWWLSHPYWLDNRNVSASLLLNRLYNRGVQEVDTSPNEARKASRKPAWTVALAIST